MENDEEIFLRLTSEEMNELWDISEIFEFIQFKNEEKDWKISEKPICYMKVFFFEGEQNQI